jgi:hypothetical protein
MDEAQGSLDQSGSIRGKEPERPNSLRVRKRIGSVLAETRHVGGMGRKKAHGIGKAVFDRDAFTIFRR